MAASSQSLTEHRTAVDNDRQPGQGRIGAILTDYLGDRALRQVGLIIGLAAAIAAGIALYSWAQKPVYRELFMNLPAEDSSAVIDALQAASIAYRTDPDSGAIMVPADAVHKARLTLAGQGLPNTGGVGFESLRGDQGFGTSRFVETARFHRSLETELARTISSLQAVRSARVHLAIPERSAFLRDRREPRASITIGLFPGRRLTDGQVAAVTNMVSSAVPELALENVTVVDQRGRLLTGDQGGGDDDASGEQLAYKRRLEQAYGDRIKALLSPMVGKDRVRAEVNARINYSLTERTEELYNPEQTAVRSEQSSERISRGDTAAEGVPGALSNQPPGPGTLQDGAQADAANGDTAKETIKDQSTSTTRNYEVSKTIRHVQSPRGRVERLSVAVLLDTPAGADGQSAGFSDEQLAQMQSLVRQAVGFDASRGDTVDVVSMPFQPQIEAPEPISTPIWEHPWVWEAGKILLAAALGLVLILVVIRPLVNGLLGRDRRAGPQPRPAAADALPADGQPPQLTGPDQQAVLAQQARGQLPQGGSNNYKDRLDAAREVVGQEPALAANVVKNWLAQGNE